MRNKILLILFATCLILPIETVLFPIVSRSNPNFNNNNWGPKIKLEITDNNDTQNICYFGVDEKATDSWDKDVIFEFDGKQLQENEFLPPPGFSLYCYMVKDSLMESDSQSYVDFREIPKDLDNFKHKFRLRVNWGISSNITIKWGDLPAGIDSAKFRSYHWYDEDQYIDMRSTPEFQTDRKSNFIKFDFIIWYNKNSSIKEKQSPVFINTYPTPAVNYIYIDSNKYTSYTIRNLCGQIIYTDSNIINRNSIEVSYLTSGIYLIELVDTLGKISFGKLIKK